MLACGRGSGGLVSPPLSSVLRVLQLPVLLAGFLTCLVSVTAFRVLGCGLMVQGLVLTTPSLACDMTLSLFSTATSLTLCCMG